jgi:LysR family transcriptional regulator (chromosome initiation inhibitor)
MAAITTDADPVPGCSSTPLGAMRYRPMSSPAFARRWFPDGATAAALTRAPVVVFDRKDDLQAAYLRRRGVDGVPPVHYVPSSADYLDAVRLGLGWGMVPDLQLALAGYELVDLDPAGAADVVLHWQQWRLRSPSLDRVAAAVLAAGRAALAPPPALTR